MRNIASFEDACNVLQLNFKKMTFDFLTFPEKHRKALEARIKLTIIAEALNDGWQPDWGDDDECKYEPWFIMGGSSGSSFSYGGCSLSISCVAGGSGLFYKTRELGEYAGKQFKDLYHDYLFVKK
ncbi:MAG: hypothetical protein ABGX00_12985 [Allomuricauda sp.]